MYGPERNIPRHAADELVSRDGLSEKKYKSSAYESEGGFRFNEAKKAELAALKARLDAMPGSPEMEAAKRMKEKEIAARKQRAEDVEAELNEKYAQFETDFPPGTSVYYKKTKMGEETNEWEGAEVVEVTTNSNGVPELVLKKENGHTLAIGDVDKRVSKEKPLEMVAKERFDAQRKQLEIDYPPGSFVDYKTKTGWVTMKVKGASMDKDPGLILTQDNRTFAISGKAIKENLVRKNTPEVDGMEKAA